MAKNKIFVQIVWGGALVLAGIGVFWMIPQKMAQIETIGSYSSALGLIRFCFYLIGVLLIGGGSKKIYDNYRKLGG
jgi:hypothetical protein